jgi:hypothetical protein
MYGAENSWRARWTHGRGLVYLARDHLLAGLTQGME